MPVLSRAEGTRRIRVALDVMGGDGPPDVRVQGALDAARHGDADLLLVGVPDAVEAALARLGGAAGLPVAVVPAGEAVREGDHPALVLRQRPDVAVGVAARLVKEGRAGAAVSAGNTGASMAAAQLIYGLLPGVERVGAGGTVFGPLAPQTFLIDGGANVDVRPDQLLCFAVLGVSYVRDVLGIAEPAVAILANGAERGKGNKLVKEAYPLFEASGLRFIGQVEGHDVLSGRANVVVCDGFVGNILIKFLEALGPAVARHVLDAAGDGVPMAARERLLAEAKAACSPAEAGGPLLGVDGVFVVGHGASGPHEIAGMVRTAAQLARDGFVERMRAALTNVQRASPRTAAETRDRRRAVR